MTLEEDLKQEMPGILWKLIHAAPGVFYLWCRTA